MQQILLHFKVDDYRTTLKKFIVRYLPSLLIWFPVSVVLGNLLMQGDPEASWFSAVETLLFWLDLYPFAILAACFGGAIFSFTRNSWLFMASLYVPIIILLICLGIVPVVVIALL